MPFSFPSSPSVGATSTQNGRTYTYAGNNVWELAASGGGSVVTAATVSAFPATGSSNGVIYVATDTARAYIWAGAYLEIGSSGGGGSGDGTDATLRALFVPPAPTGVTATAGNAQATVSWTAPTVLAQIPIQDYREQYSSDGGTTWTTFTAAASTAASSTITGLTNSTAYVFRVAGVNAAGVGAYSTASSTVTPTAGTPPGAPTGLAATAGNAQIALSWTAPASAGSSAITGYTVEYTPSGGSAQTVSTGSTSASYTLTGLTNGTAYTVRVAGVSAVGTGTYTASSSPVTPIDLVFRAIPTLTSNTSSGTAEANTSAGGAAWNLFDKTTSEYYTARNGNDTPKRHFQYSFAGGEKSYIGGYSMTAVSSPSSSIYSWELSGSNDGTNFTLIDTQSTSWSSGGQTKTFTLASPANYSTYRWTLTPDNTNDTFAGLREVQLLATVPDSPTSLTATSGNAQVSLTWTAPGYTGGSAITDYAVQFSTNSGSTWTNVSRTASTTASQVVSGLANGTAYVFRVAGINSNGIGTYTAASSSVTPSAGPPVTLSAPYGAATGSGTVGSPWVWQSGSGFSSGTSAKLITATGAVTVQATLVNTGGGNCDAGESRSLGIYSAANARIRTMSSGAESLTAGQYIMMELDCAHARAEVWVV